MEQQSSLQSKLDEFIENANTQWMTSFKKENFLHLDEPLLRKENDYYVVNIKSEVMENMIIFQKNALRRSP